MMECQTPGTERVLYSSFERDMYRHYTTYLDLITACYSADISIIGNSGTPLPEATLDRRCNGAYRLLSA